MIPIFYPNRNHGIYGNNARLHLYTKMTNFLNSNLKGRTQTAQPEEEVEERPVDAPVPKQKPLTKGQLKKKKVLKKKKA